MALPKVCLSASLSTAAYLEFSFCPGRLAYYDRLGKLSTGNLQKIDRVDLSRRSDWAFIASPGGNAPKGRLLGDARGSLDGKFVAMATTTMGDLRIAEAIDMSSGAAPRRILVFDTGNGSAVASVKFTWQHEYAFAPDSSSFALLSRGILKLFSLPR